MGKKKRAREVEEFSESETVTEKNSPPYKMTRTGGKMEEVLSKLTSLETRFGVIEKELANISKLVKDFDEMRKEVTELKESCEGFKRLELETKKRSVLIRGISLNTGDKFETRGETKAALAAFFERLGVKPYLVDYQRLGGRRNDEDGSKISIRVQFMDLDTKLNLFDALKNKGKEFQSISILTDYPSFQIEDFKKLSEIGYRIRTDKPGTRTRVISKGLGLALQSRTNSTDRWTTVSN